MGIPRKRWIDTVNECLRKRGLDVRQARKMVQGRSEWRGFVRGNEWGVAWGMSPRPRRDATVEGYRSYMKPLSGNLWPSLQLKGCKWKKFVFLLFLKLCIFFTVTHFVV